MRILVVEDDRVIATGLEYSLQQEGYDVKNAYSYKEAKEQIDNVPFDLYLLDITLPDGNGYDLCKEIKKKKDTPVIFLTALEDK